jgi:hypothetical protein
VKSVIGIVRFGRARLLVLGVLRLAGIDTHAQTDPRPSWNDGSSKQAILGFGKSTTRQANPKFMPPEAHIAAFDQAGTAWVEQPMYMQVICCWSAGHRRQGP